MVNQSKISAHCHTQIFPNIKITKIDYDPDSLDREFEKLFCKLNKEQKTIYDSVMEKIDDKRGGLYFVYGSSGTGTYKYKYLHTNFLFHDNLLKIDFYNCRKDIFVENNTYKS